MSRPILFVAVLALIVAACTPEAVEDPATTTTVPVSTTTTVAAATTLPPTTTTTTEPPDGFGGEVTIGLDVAIESLNPFAPNSYSERLGGNLVWAIVYDIDPDTWEKIPDVVKGLPSRSGGITINDDGSMDVRYEIVDDATWSDGKPITGFDLAFTAAVMRDMALAGEGSVDPVMATVRGTEGDGKSATITFSEPTLAFEDALWIILPSHALEGVDLVNGTDGSDWPSGGPFVVDAFDPHNEARFVRNEAYWKTDEQGRSLPYLDAVTITETTEPGLQSDEPVNPIGAFVAREIDVAPIFIHPPDYARMETAVANGAEFQRVRTPIIEHLTFNFSETRLEGNPDSVNEFSDFRRTLAASIDREQILEDTGVPWFPETPGMLIPMGESAWSIYEVGIAQIPQLPDGATSVLTTTGNADERPKIVEAITPAFVAAGVEYELKLEDSQQFFQETIVEGTYDIGMWAWVSDGSYESRLSMLEEFDPAASPPDGNFGNWGSGGTANEATARFSEIVAEAHTTVDAGRFDELVAEAESILAQELPLIPLFSRGSGLGVWPGVMTGIVHNGSRSGFTWNIETWQRVGE